MIINYGPDRSDGTRAERDTERITCSEALCRGCDFIHRRAIGEMRYYIEGERASKAAFEEYVAVLL